MAFRFKLAFIILISSLKMAFAAHCKSGAYYNIKDYGAIGDGITMDSKAINKTIEAAANAGGGTVYFPAGNYLSGVHSFKKQYLLIYRPGRNHHSSARECRKRL